MGEWVPCAYVDTLILKNNVKERAVPYTSHQFESKMTNSFQAGYKVLGFLLL